MTIYGLIDPRTNRVRYIGKSADAHRRYRFHLNGAASASERHYPSRQWIGLLRRLNLKPGLLVIEECDGDGCAEERFHIALARADGLPLLNCTDGGEGTLNPTPETRERMAAAKRGRKLSPEHAAKIAAAHRGQKRSEATLAKLRACAQRQDPERLRRWQASGAAANRGRKCNPVHVAKRAAAMMGHPTPPEVREKIGAAHRGRKLSEAHKAALRVGQAKPSAKMSAVKRRKLGLGLEQGFLADCAAGATVNRLRAKYQISYNCLRRHCLRLGVSPPAGLATGERNTRSKLNPDAVREIRRLYGEGHTMTAIGKRFGVTRLPVRMIVTGRTWKHVA
jgi:hypothetical protein